MAGAEPPAMVVADGEALGDDPTDAPRAGLHSVPDARSGRAEVTERLVESARELVWDAGGPSFTVTQVVAAAGTSLKSFYRCFASKDELLVALFEAPLRGRAGA
jgi:TetR/AcrR family transcriptional regulator